MSDEIRINGRQIETLKRVSKKLEILESDLDARRIGEIADEVQDAVDKVIANREAIERFFELREGETDFITPGLEAISGAAGGISRGVQLGVLTRNPVVGAVAAVVLGILGAVIGSDLEERRREALGSAQQRENERFRFEQQLKAVIDGIRSQDDILEEFQKREAVQHRIGFGN